MSNILAIAHKELKSYFSSPIAYIAIGMWALLYGYFFVAILSFFVRQSMQMSQMRHAGAAGDEPQPADDPAAAAERHHPDPVPDADGHDADLFGGEAVGDDRAAADLAAHRLPDRHAASSSARWRCTACMLAVTLIHVGLLFVYGRPEWKPIVTAYIGLLLLGGCFISVGLFISSLTKNQIVAGMVDLRGVPVAVDHHLDRQLLGPDGRQAHAATCRSSTTSTTSAKASSTRRTSIYYVSFITFGLFLTAKSVDSERWRG